MAAVPTIPIKYRLLNPLDVNKCIHEGQLAESLPLCTTYAQLHEKLTAAVTAFKPSDSVLEMSFFHHSLDNSQGKFIHDNCSKFLIEWWLVEKRETIIYRFLCTLLIFKRFSSLSCSSCDNHMMFSETLYVNFFLPKSRSSIFPFHNSQLHHSVLST